jgi:hypothetical protein
METSCNKDSLGSVGLDLQEFDGCGEQSLLRMEYGWCCWLIVEDDPGVQR